MKEIAEIQEKLARAARALSEVTTSLNLEACLTDLETIYPPDMDIEAVGDGVVPPPLAWEIHADVGNAKILLEEVIGSLEKASRHTTISVDQDWLGSKLAEIKDSPLRHILLFLSSRRES